MALGGGSPEVAEGQMIVVSRHAATASVRIALLQPQPGLSGHRFWLVAEVVGLVNLILPDWPPNCSFGHSSRCFPYVRDCVEKKTRHHLARPIQRHGFGWKRWSRAWLYGRLRLFHEYRVAC